MVEVEKYAIRVEWSEEDDCFISRCIEFPSLGAHGKSRQDAITEMEKVLGTTIEWMKEEGESIPEPLATRNYKGNLSLRIPPETHKELAFLAAEKGLSINQLITSIIERNLYYDQIIEYENDIQNQLKLLSTEFEVLKNFNSEMFYRQSTNPSTDISQKLLSQIAVYLMAKSKEEVCEEKDIISA